MNFILRKNLTSKIILVISTLIFLFPQITLAQAQGGTTPTPPQPGAQVASAAKAATDADSAKESSDNWLVRLLKAGIYPLVNEIILAVTLIPQIIAALLMGLSGMFLQWIIGYTVIDMSSAIKGMGAIDVAWVAFRDLANIFFIFILLFTAIQTILNVGGVNTKKTIVNVVITAIFLNFSLFFTKIIIDASNIIAIGLYKSTIGQSTVAGLGGILLDKMNVLDFYHVVASIMKSPVHTLIAQIGSTLFMFIAACVFFAISLFFIIRFIVLIFLMILSPVAFAATALPKDSYSSKWWDTLISQCLFAPVFMAMMWIVVKIVGGVLPKEDVGANFANIVNGDASLLKGTLPLLFNFIVIIVMLIFSLVVAKSLASKGAGSMMKMASWAQGKVGRGIVRGTGIAQLDRKFADSQFGNSTLGRNMRRMTTGAMTNLDFGDGKSVQKVDKEEKKLNKEYAKKVDEDIVKDHARKMGKDRERELPIQKRLQQRYERIANQQQADKNQAERALTSEIAAGTALSKDQLRKERDALAKEQADIDNGATPDPSRTARMKGYIDRISRTEALTEKVAEQDNLKKQTELKLDATKKRIRDIENKAPATTEKEKEDLRNAREKRASDLENNAFGIKGLGIKALSPKHAFNFLPEWIRDSAKNLIPQRDVDAAVKEIREAKVGKRQKSDEAKLQEALDALKNKAGGTPGTTT